MKIVRMIFLQKVGAFSHTEEFNDIMKQITDAIEELHHPHDQSQFVINPTEKGNGVKPISSAFEQALINKGWNHQHKLKTSSGTHPGPIDATFQTSDGKFFAVEWETGNISSSHRALNKITIGLLGGILAGGVLILPSRTMYRYLTDRVGNYAELEPYFPVWESLSISEGVIAVIEIEHDSTSSEVPLIAKGTDGRALI